MATYQIPEKIKLFNVYNEGNQLQGVASEVTLPDFESASESISIAGVLGEFESPAPGLFGSMEIEIPFISINESIFKIWGTEGFADITLRGSQMVSDIGSGKITERPIRIVVRGPVKATKLGSFKSGAPTNSSLKLEVLYIKIEIGGKEMVELDKMNCIFKVNGKDLLAQTRRNI